MTSSANVQLSQGQVEDANVDAEYLCSKCSKCLGSAEDIGTAAQMSGDSYAASSIVACDDVQFNAWTRSACAASEVSAVDMRIGKPCKVQER